MNGYTFAGAVTELPVAAPSRDLDQREGVSTEESTVTIPVMSDTEFEWRGEFANDEVNRLHAEAFNHPMLDDDWLAIVARHSLGWVTARQSGRLVGFVNVIGDGTVHAWIQDEMVAVDARRRRVGSRLIEVVRHEARAAGCEWLHVDFDEDLAPFYVDATGFTPAAAGLIDLTAD